MDVYRPGVSAQYLAGAGAASIDAEGLRARSADAKSRL